MHSAASAPAHGQLRAAAGPALKCAPRQLCAYRRHDQAPGSAAGRRHPSCKLSLSSTGSHGKSAGRTSSSTLLSPMHQDSESEAVLRPGRGPVSVRVTEGRGRELKLTAAAGVAFDSHCQWRRGPVARAAPGGLGPGLGQRLRRLRRTT